MEISEKEYKMLIAQQVVLLKRIEKLENKLNNTSRFASVSDYQEELRREAKEIINQIRV